MTRVTRLVHNSHESVDRGRVEDGWVFSQKSRGLGLGLTQVDEAGLLVQ